MLGRINVNSNPLRVYKAAQRVKIYLWSAKYVGRHSESDQTYIAHTKGNCSPHKGTPMPDPSGGIVPIPIPLDIGEELWIVSESVSLMGLTIERL